MYKHNPLFLIGFASVLLAGCASQPLRLPEAEIEPPAATAPLIHGTNMASSVAMQALSYLGTPCRTGGESPRTGFDCSGLVVYAYRVGAGLALPRDTYDLSHVGEPVARNQLRPGDLVFYNTQGRAYSHVGIYLGNDRFVHAPSSGSEVRVDNLRGYWMRHYSGARRIIESPPG
jgi:cell wall-associated NlpC family hydrolase